MKRPLSFETLREPGLVVAATSLIAGTYGLVRLAFGLYLSDIQASVGLTSGQAGWVSSGASVTYCAGALIGMVGDRRPQLLVAFAAITASLGAVGMAVATGTTVFVLAAILGSVGAGLASPALVGVVAGSVPECRRDRAQAVVNCGTGPGLIVAGAIALALLPDWRLGFAIGAVLTASAAVLVLVLDVSRQARPKKLEPVHQLQRGLGAIRLPALGALLLGASSVAVWTYGRKYLVAEGLGGTASTLAWIAIGVGGTATVVTAGLQTRVHPALAWSLTSIGVGASVVLLAIGADQLVVAAAACLLFGWAFVAATSALIAWAAQLIPDRSAAGTAALFITLTLGQAGGSALAGTVADLAGLRNAFFFASALALLAAACSLLVRSRSAVAGFRGSPSVFSQENLPSSQSGEVP